MGGHLVAAVSVKIGRRRAFAVGVACAGLAMAMAARVTRADVDIATARASLLLQQEPAGAVTLTAAKAKLTPAPQPVVVAGRIGGRGTEPFGKNEATFSMLEIPADDHAAKPGHKPDDCPFCKKRNANSPIAAVSFVVRRQGDSGRCTATFRSG